MGLVESVSLESETFTLELGNGRKIIVGISKETYFDVLRNVGDISRDRTQEPSEEELKQIGSRDSSENKQAWDRKRKLLKYVKPGALLSWQGIVCDTEEDNLYSARRIILMGSEPSEFGWERTHWWIQQTNTLFEQWLDTLFQSRREFTESDFAEFYRTNLNTLGGTTDNPIQESATMSRFLYGLSSAYQLTGNERALSAAKACAKYIVNAYSNPSHDGEYIFWKFGRVKEGNTTKEIIGSLNPEDRGSFPLYEQIYVLSGLTQYYRVTQDTLILSYIVRTIKTFQKYYFDSKRAGDECYTGKGGYFSHLDPVSLRPDASSLQHGGYDNRAKKNWNSIGDHIPAYLINLLVSIDPLPTGDSSFWEELRSLCRSILDDCVTNILDHFGPEKSSKFVKERFYKDWQYDNSWGWQQDRGIVGHNLKISWNLTRCAHYYTKLNVDYSESKPEKAEYYQKLAMRCYAFAKDVGNNMKEVGVDLARGGIFDALERNPGSEMPTEFAWGSTKDFWQQEQAILAYYIMHGIDPSTDESKDYLAQARSCSAFWNLFFIDHDNRKIHFRTTESGEPVVEGQYSNQAGHAVAGYHTFELNYLAHIYIRTYVDRGDDTRNFVLHYRPSLDVKTLNVLPDFFRPDDLEIAKVKVNGINKPVTNPEHFQIDISSFPEDSVVMVEYRPRNATHDENQSELDVEFCLKS